VASFAFGQRVAVLDTNVGRVLARAVANRTLGAREACDLAYELLPASNVASHNQALLDLGAQYCRSSRVVPRARSRGRAAGTSREAPTPRRSAPRSRAVNRRLRARTAKCEAGSWGYFAAETPR